jgi:outer membrane murein-binding lipoprotein Lpp
MLKAIGDLKKRVPESTQLQQLADKYQKLADDYKAQADKARAAESAGSCK